MTDFWTDKVACEELCNSVPSGDITVDGFGTYYTPVFGQTDVVSISAYSSGVYLAIGDAGGTNPALGPTISGGAAQVVYGRAYNLSSAGGSGCEWIGVGTSAPFDYVTTDREVLCRPDNPGYTCTDGLGLAVPQGVTVLNTYTATAPFMLSNSVTVDSSLTVSNADLEAMFGVTFDSGGTNIPTLFHLIIEAGGHGFQVCFVYHTCY